MGPCFLIMGTLFSGESRFIRFARKVVFPPIPESTSLLEILSSGQMASFEAVRDNSHACMRAVATRVAVTSEKSLGWADVGTTDPIWEGFESFP